MAGVERSKVLSIYDRTRMVLAEKRRSAVVVEPPVVNGVKLLPSQRDRLARAEALALGGWRNRQRAAALVREVERELVEARDGIEVEKGIADTLNRAARRNEAFQTEEVEIGDWRRDDNGAVVRVKGAPVLDVRRVRRSSRVDGLANLYRCGAISHAEKQAGDRLRELLDAVAPPVVTASLDRTGRSKRADTNPIVVAAVRRGHGLLVLASIRREIGDVAWSEMEAVVGGGATVRSLSPGRESGRIIERLRGSLIVAESHIKKAEVGLLPRRNARGM